MVILWWVLGGCLALLALLLILPFHVYLKYDQSASGDAKFTVRLFLYSQKLGFDIPIKHKTETPKSEKEKKTAEDKTPFGKVFEMFDNIRRLRTTHLLSREYIKKHIFLEMVLFDFEFGLSDAAKTGMATGAVWAAVYNLFAFVTRNFSVGRHEFHIQPNYEKEVVNAKLEGIIKFRIVHIIGILLVVLKNYLKTGRQSTKAQSA